MTNNDQQNTTKNMVTIVKCCYIQHYDHQNMVTIVKCCYIQHYFHHDKPCRHTLKQCDDVTRQVLFRWLHTKQMRFYIVILLNNDSYCNSSSTRRICNCFSKSKKTTNTMYISVVNFTNIQLISVIDSANFYNLNRHTTWHSLEAAENRGGL